MAKSPNAFRTISEAAEEVGAPQHVLRFWETKFDFVAPLKRAGGRRFYRPDDIQVLKAVRRLLHDEGLTIRGVQRLAREQGAARIAAYGDPSAALEIDSTFAAEAGATPPQGDDGLTRTPAPALSPALPPALTQALGDILSDLEAAQARLERILRR